MVSFGYAALRCHCRASSALAAASARSRTSVGSASSTSWANPGLIRDRETLAVVACDAKSGAAAARGAVNGFALMEFGEERTHLVLLAVRPSHRRAGIGQRMLEWMLESARCAGIASIHLELRAGNEAARRFYRAMGFYETVLVPGYYRSGEGRKEGALRMLRVLRVPGPLPAAWRPPRMEDR